MFKQLSRLGIKPPIFTSPLGGDSRARLFAGLLLVCLAIIGCASFACAILLSEFVAQNMLDRDARVAMDVVNSVVQQQNAGGALRQNVSNQATPQVRSLLEHLRQSPEVLGAHIYAIDRTILWSSESAMIGRKSEWSSEVELAFNGIPSSEVELFDIEESGEYARLPIGNWGFIENHLPIFSEKGQNVVAVVEIYREPKQLLETIHASQNFIWGASAASGVILFSVLSFILRLAMVKLRKQEELFLATERLAVIGEMASATAHNLRNPLAAIRSCAELVLDDKIPATAKQPLRDIISQSERLESWIRSFLINANEGPSKSKRQVLLESLIEECLEHFASQFNAHNIHVEIKKTMSSPVVRVDVNLLSQVFNSIISNSLEAMPKGGTLTFQWCLDNANAARIIITDSGPGIPEEMISHIFQPFFTGKEEGLGIGLSLARRAIERMGGALEIKSMAGAGVTAVLMVPIEVMN